MRLPGTKLRAWETHFVGAPFTQAFQIGQSRRDASWELAAVKIREEWVHKTAASLILQTEAEWNYVLSKEWDKVKHQLRASWEKEKGRPATAAPPPPPR